MKGYKYFISYGIMRNKPMEIIGVDNGTVVARKKIEEYKEIKELEKALKEELIKGNKEKIENIFDIKIINYVLIGEEGEE